MHFPLAAGTKEKCTLADPLRHPDLVRLGRRMRDHLDETLDAEQHAARAAALRRRTVRDVLLDAEDRGREAILSCADGEIYRGPVAAVGADHVTLAGDGSTQRFVVIAHIVSVEVR